MKDRKADLKRRHFLVTLGAGGATAAAAVAAAKGQGSPAAVLPQAADTVEREAGLSEHARKYYRTARI